MANQLYGYNPSYGASAAASASLSNVYTSRSLTEPYLSDSSLLSSSRYLSSDHLSSDPAYYSIADRHSSMFDSLRYSSTDIGGVGPYSSRISGGIGASGSTNAVETEASVDHLVASIKRPSEALYHQTVLGAHNTIGQSEAWFSTNSLVKRSRYESASNLPIYPQRPGEKDCAYYMLTRTCKFGDSCKFDHPIWVPEGGIPDWKEVLVATANELLPQRPGEPDCPYFLKTQKCKFGQKCKFNHPQDKIASLGASENTDVSVLPERPSELPCAFYMKTGKCKYGASCKFHHPKDIQISSAGNDNATGEPVEYGARGGGTIGDVKLHVSFTPALLHNSKGLPIRLGEVDCPFYLKTGSCKYGATCRYNHPDRSVINPSASAASLGLGVVNPAVSLLHPIDPRISQTMMGLGPTIYPQRAGQMECDYYMKTGECKFGERCKFHHPIDRSAPVPTKLQQNVKLTLAGFPRREGAIICPFYLKTGACKYGVTCKFDHPPPAEVMAMANSQGTSGGQELNEEDKETETVRGGGGEDDEEQ